MRPLLACSFLATIAQAQSLQLTVNNPNQTVIVNQPYTVTMTMTVSTLFIDYPSDYVAVGFSLYGAQQNCPNYAGGTFSLSPNNGQDRYGDYFLPANGNYTVTFSGNAMSGANNCTFNFNVRDLDYSINAPASANVNVVVPYLGASTSPSSQTITTNSTYTVSATFTSYYGWTGFVALRPAYQCGSSFPTLPGTWSGGGSSIPANGSYTSTFTGGPISVPESCTVSLVATDAGDIQIYATANASLKVISPQTPVNVSVSPSSGAGAAQTFTFTASDPNGSQFISSMQMLVNYGADGGGACYLQYSPGSNIINLMNDQGTAWSAGQNLGAAGTLANSQCQLNVGASSVSMSGNNITVNLALAFLAGLPGPQNVYMLTYEESGLNTGWQQMGTWTTSSVSSQPPVPVSVSPASGTGLTATFSFSASSANGGSYIMQMHTVVNSSLTGVGACYVYYNRAGNYVYLLDDSGGWTQYAYLGSGTNLHNSQCTLNTGLSNAVVSGNNLTLNLALTFASGWAGNKNTWMYLYDRGDHAVGWSQMGTWTVGTPPSSTTTSVTPSSGNGVSQVFTATFTDTDRPQDISEADFLINSSVSSAASCYVKWTPASNLYLMNDTGTAWLGPITIGASATLQNNQCVINGAGSSVTLSGNGSSSTVTLQLGITFFASFDGGKNLYTVVYGSGGNSGWQTEGTWLVEPPPPPVGTPGDPRRIGVRPTGAYWGAAGEQIDLVSFNLNFALPLVKPQTRAGSGVSFLLSYNSQVWRQDSTGTSNLIPDVGYGLGWRLQAGSVAPVYAGSPAKLDHYVFSDATGAQYKLSQNTNNVWTSIEGIYVSYDAAANRLYFPGGTYWVMGAQSAANEPDAGALYPTLMEDTNGNQITVTYYPGAGAGTTANTSARINQIQDMRGPYNTTPPSLSYSFTYNTDSPPHLTGITNIVGTPEAYTFSYLENQALYSPFSPPISFGNTVFLQSIGITGLGIAHNFQYSSAGEMTQVTTPMGGILQWQYRTYGYANGLNYREVQTRQMKPSASGTLYTWNLTTDTNPNVHGTTTVADTGAGTQKVWTFQTTAGPPFAGLAATYEERGTSATLLHKDYTWAQDAANNVYLVTVATTQDPGTSYAAQTKTTQALDTYGNILVSYIYDYGNLNTPARTYSYSYFSDSNYTSRYIRNRLQSATVTPNGGGAMTLASNYYDHYSTSDGLCPNPNHNWSAPLQDQTGLTLHDSAYNVNFLYRGNPTYTYRLGDVHCYGYVINGAPYIAADGAANQVNVSLSGSTNYSLPAVLTPNGNGNLATTVSYSSFFAVTSLVGPNGATTSTNYDAYGRPASTSIPDGATTTYTYTYNPNVQTATLTDAAGQRWTKTTYDGFGRTISVVKGHDNVSISEVDTQYAPCACSPLGKMSRVSQPYPPGATPVWTTYTYDGSGRTLTVTAADGSVTQYTYQGNNTTVTDPAGKWKTYTTDAFGNLTVVTEPRPGGGTNYVSNYTYNAANQLTNVQLVRDGVTQQRSFQWSGTDLASATNPENGTVTYTYDGAHHVLTRTDAKGQVTGYTYDLYGRLTAVAHYPQGLSNAADPNQQVNYYYDTYSDSIATNTWGRLAAVTWGSLCQQNTQATEVYTYVYGYNAAGRVTGQKMQVTVGVLSAPQPGCSQYPVAETASYGWDNEGRMTSLIYPGNTNSLSYTYDAMGHLKGMTDSTTGATASATYGTAGEMDSLNDINGTTLFTYNSLWQLTGESVTTNVYPYTGWGATYVYPAGQNNGRISQVIDSLMGTVNYTYDSLNRLATAQATDGSWGNAYSYDGFSNLTAKTVTAGSAPLFSAGYNAATNQQIGNTYDANGNPVGAPGQPLLYDVENRLLNSQDGSTTFGYDPQGKRVLRQTSVSGSNYVAFYSEFTMYGITGQRLTSFTVESSTGNQGLCNSNAPFCTLGPTPGYVYFGSKLIAEPNRTYWLPSAYPPTQVGVLTDRLGSVRSGISYYPWGEEKTSPPTQDGLVKFGTYFRDMPGQDYADQRYYTATAGRFYTPDPAGLKAVSLRNPTSWNRYAYVNDDPINFNDPSGLIDWAAVGKGTLGFAGGILSWAGAITGEVGTVGGSTPVTIYLIIQGAGLIAGGVYTINQGFIDNPNLAPPLSQTASNLVNGAPGSLIGGAVSGGNPTAIAVGANLNTTVGNALNFGTLPAGPNPSTTDVVVGLGGLAAGWIGPVLEPGALTPLPLLPGPQVVPNPVPTVINVSGTSTLVDPVSSPIPTDLSPEGDDGPQSGAQTHTL